MKLPIFLKNALNTVRALYRYIFDLTEVSAQHRGHNDPGRLLIVSNRLPVTVSISSSNVAYEPSSGGLATGLASYIKNSEHKNSSLWIGWPGSTICEEKKLQVQTDLFHDHACVPVYLDETAMDQFYHGFCNKTLWPLFHYFQVFTEFRDDFWKNYEEVNQRFCDAVLEHAGPNDTVWVHDYHLMLLPKMLREKIPKLKIVFFLHIPFPTYEIFRLLPKNWRESILSGLLGADVIGFHTHSDVQYFLSSALRILGIEHTTGQLRYDGRLIKVDAFPMGIDFQKFNSAASSSAVTAEKDTIRNSFGNRKLVLSLDRLDYTKGIKQRLLGFERFIDEHPEWVGNVSLMMVIIPSRIAVGSYQDMKKQLDEEIGRINGRFTKLDWTPIIYRYKSIPFTELVALYAAADVALVTPLRDGMNLIAKEYLASKADATGVLILSEMAGAAKELTEAIIINPNNTEEMSAAIHTALNMPVEEQRRRNEHLRSRLERYDVARWAKNILDKVNEVFDIRIRSTSAVFLGNEQREFVKRALRMSVKKLILLDHDGTLVPFMDDPILAEPGPNVISLLSKLCNVTGTDVVIISGRDKATLESWYGGSPVQLVAEHGASVRNKNGVWRTKKHLHSGWKQDLRPIFEKYADALPGSFVEEKEHSLVWHYRMADLEHGAMKKKELIDDLVHFTANVDLSVLQGNKIVEIRNSTVNKGSTVGELVSKKAYDLCIAIGDDVTDEDMFRAVPKGSITIKVGTGDTAAAYYTKSYRDVIDLIKNLTD